MNSKLLKNFNWLKLEIGLGIILEIVFIVYFSLPIIFGAPAPILLIKSESMLPVIAKGDIVVIKSIAQGEDLNNQIIAFYDPSRGRIIVHRVIGEQDGCFITKGDNSQGIDFFNPCKDYILGKAILYYNLYLL
ncbi:MAG: signal peptidase I [Patescibacteria group bacterium]|jgi:signal peptidase